MRSLSRASLPILFATLALAQTPTGLLTLDLLQTLARARQYAGQIQTANLTLSQATQDRVQARAATPRPTAPAPASSSAMTALTFSTTRASSTRTSCLSS